MTDRLKEIILEVLKADGRLWDDDKKELNQTLLLDLVEKIDENIINLLLNKKEIRDKFFIKIKDAYVFKTNDFRFFVEENKVDNSYTTYERRIGLSDGKRFISNNNLVVLDFPYKDCVLEGGQSTEEGIDSYFEYSNKIGKYEQKQAKRKEIFFNEILAKDEIDRLFDEKAFLNWKRYTVKGEKKVGEIKRDENGTIRENLIIKGNNLLALHSLKKQFTGKVKLIYIDPPYNTGNDEFKYNDNFNHSAWLTFMKNRLEVAEELLSDDGAIFVQISDKEVGYLHVLMDEMFRDQFINKICIKTRAPEGFKIVNQGLYESAEYILVYGKKKEKWKYIPQYEICDYDENYKFIILNKDASISEWKIDNLYDYVSKKLGFDSGKEAVKKLGKDIILKKIGNFALENSDKVFRLTVINNDAGKETLIAREKSLNDKDKIFVVKREPPERDRLIINGGLMTFYSSKIREIDGQKVPTNSLSNIWTDIAWEGIAKEGGVTLNKGKKPEKLIKRIIEMSTEKGDIVLDYHIGSGTTCAVAHKMGRQYIGIEQLDYEDNDSVKRLQNVINGDQSGISKSVNWQGGGDFVYFELAKWNEEAKEKILETKSLDELEKLFDELYYKYFLNYNLKIKEFKEKVILEKEFKALPLGEQKKMFLTMLDLNQMYVQKTEMSDRKFGIKKEDQDLTLKFYGDD